MSCLDEHRHLPVFELDRWADSSHQQSQLIHRDALVATGSKQIEDHASLALLQHCQWSHAQRCEMGVDVAGSAAVDIHQAIEIQAPPRRHVLCTPLL